MYGGDYWENQAKNRMGTGSLGEHATKNQNWDREHKLILKELQNLQLRTRNENWRYKQ